MVGLNPFVARINIDVNIGYETLTAKNHFSAVRICCSQNLYTTCSKDAMAINPVANTLTPVPMCKNNPCAVQVPVFPAACGYITSQ